MRKKGLDKQFGAQVVKLPIRHSDEKLKKFKENILKKLTDARRIEKPKALSFNDNGTDDTSKKVDICEESFLFESERVNSSTFELQGSLIQLLEDALIRIENKTYGICRVTDELISDERLFSVPYALCHKEHEEAYRNRKKKLKLTHA